MRSTTKPASGLLHAALRKDLETFSSKVKVFRSRKPDHIHSCEIEVFTEVCLLPGGLEKDFL